MENQNLKLEHIRNHELTLRICTDNQFNFTHIQEHEWLSKGGNWIYRESFIHQKAKREWQLFEYLINGRSYQPSIEENSTVIHGWTHRFITDLNINYPTAMVSHRSRILDLPLYRYSNAQKFKFHLDKYQQFISEIVKYANTAQLGTILFELNSPQVINGKTKEILKEYYEKLFLLLDEFEISDEKCQQFKEFISEQSQNLNNLETSFDPIDNLIIQQPVAQLFQNYQNGYNNIPNFCLIQAELYNVSTDETLFLRNLNVCSIPQIPFEDAKCNELLSTYFEFDSHHQIIEKEIMGLPQPNINYFNINVQNSQLYYSSRCIQNNFDNIMEVFEDLYKRIHYSLFKIMFKIPTINNILIQHGFNVNIDAKCLLGYDSDPQKWEWMEHRLGINLIAKFQYEYGRPLYRNIEKLLIKDPRSEKAIQIINEILSKLVQVRRFLKYYCII